MVSTGTADAENRCVNCAIRFKCNVRPQLLSEMDADVSQLMCQWISREINPQDAVCGDCLLILQESSIANTVRRFGHKNICIPCGCSLLRAHQPHPVLVNSSERNVILKWIPPHQVERLEQVCRACWRKASRAVQRHSEQDSCRDMDIKPMFVDVSTGRSMQEHSQQDSCREMDNNPLHVDDSMGCYLQGDSCRDMDIKPIFMDDSTGCSMQELSQEDSCSDMDNNPIHVDNTTGCYLQKHSQEDSCSDMVTKPMFVDDNTSSNIPPCPPLPDPVEATTSQPTPTITMTTYKRAASTSRHCIFGLCKNTSRVLIPELLKERLLIDHSFYIPKYARICKYHLNEPHNDWNLLYTISNCSEFTGPQMEDLCSILKASALRNYVIEDIISKNSTLCKYWLGVKHCEFEQLLIQIPSISEKTNHPKRSLAIFLMKLHTGHSNSRIASLFDIASSTVFKYLNIVRQCFKEQFLELQLGTDNICTKQVAQYLTIRKYGLSGNPNIDKEQ